MLYSYTFPAFFYPKSSPSMLRYANYDIVFQEFPDEVALAVNLTGCPCHCPGCHSQYLWNDAGEVLDFERLLQLVDHYGGGITCVGLMGGDAAPDEVLSLLDQLREARPKLRTGWYSGRQDLPVAFNPHHAPDYVKLGPWREELGPLSAETTNQRMYRYHSNGSREDITDKFRVKGLKI